MPKSRKTKAKYKDFQKVKLKVGRKLAKANNETTTAFKSRSIQLKEQLHSTGTEPTTRRKLNINDLLSQCQHYNVSVRLDAVTGLRELLTSNPAMLNSHLSYIIGRVSELFLDKDAAVRQGVQRLFRQVMPQISSNQISPFFPILSAHLCCAMTHIYDDIQLDSLTLLDLCLEHYPTLSTDNRSNLLPNFIEQISRQSQTGSGKSHNSGSRSLLVNPNSKLSGLKWRVKVLGRLHRFLQATLKLNKVSQYCSDDATQQAHEYTWKDDGNNHHNILPYNAGELALGTGFTLLNTVQNKKSRTTTSKGGNIFSTSGQLKSFIDIIIPLLIQCWMETGPSQIAIDLPGNALSPDAMAMLDGVLGVLQLLLHCVRIDDQDNGPNMLIWIKQTYEKDLIQQFMPYFPFAMHERLKKSKDKAGKDKSTAPSISSLSLNLSICEIMADFISAEDLGNSTTWFNNLRNYIIQCLQRNKMNNDQMQACLRFIKRVLDVPVTDDGHKELLEAVFCCYSSKNPTSQDKLLLTQFFSELLSDGKVYVISSEPIQKWMNNLPKLLTQVNSACGSGAKGYKVREAILEVTKKVGTQAHTKFLHSLEEHCIEILAGILSSSCSETQKRSALELVQILPQIKLALLKCLTQHIFRGNISISNTQYLLDIILYRYLKSLERSHFCIAPEHFLSFLFTLTLGSQSEDLLSSIESNNMESGTLCLVVTEDIMQKWCHRLKLSKLGCHVLEQFPNNIQVWNLYTTHVFNLLEQVSAVPLYFIHSLLRGLTKALHWDQIHINCQQINVVAMATNQLLLKCVSMDIASLGNSEDKVDIKVLHSDAKETCYTFMSTRSGIFEAYLRTMYQASTDHEVALMQCECLSSILDSEPMKSNIMSCINSLHEVLNQMKEKYGENLKGTKVWSDITYKTSLFK